MANNITIKDYTPVYDNFVFLSNQNSVKFTKDPDLEEIVVLQRFSPKSKKELFDSFVDLSSYSSKDCSESEICSIIKSNIFNRMSNDFFDYFRGEFDSSGFLKKFIFDLDHTNYNFKNQYLTVLKGYSNRTSFDNLISEVSCTDIETRGTLISTYIKNYSPKFFICTFNLGLKDSPLFPNFSDLSLLMNYKTKDCELFELKSFKENYDSFIDTTTNLSKSIKDPELIQNIPNVSNQFNCELMARIINNFARNILNFQIMEVKDIIDSVKESSLKNPLEDGFPEHPEFN